MTAPAIEYEGRRRLELAPVSIDPTPIPTTIPATALEPDAILNGTVSGVSLQVEDAMLEERVGRILEDKLGHFVADIERRLLQAREIERSTAAMLSGAGPVTPARQVHTEDLNLGRHMVDGYTVTANSPGAGSIAWTSLHVVVGGVDYTIADGNTALKYATFVKPGSGTTATLALSNTKPTLAAGDALVFVNQGGTPISVLETSMDPVVRDGAVDAGAIVAGAVGTTAIANGAVTGTQLGAQAVGTANIANGAVGSTQIGSGAVGTTQIANGAVTGTQLGAQAVGTANIANGAVGSTQIGTGAVGTTNIANNAVTGTQIATGAVGSGQIASGAVGTTAIAAGAVGAGQLGAGAVTPVKLNTTFHTLY